MNAVKLELILEQYWDDEGSREIVLFRVTVQGHICGCEGCDRFRSIVEICDLYRYVSVTR